MADPIALARVVLAAFQAEYARYVHRPDIWWALNFFADEGAPDLGLSPQETGVGLGVLKDKGLIKARTGQSYQLTPEGKEVCLHPDTLEDYLRPRRSALGQQQVTINAQQIQNVQTGHGSTMNVAYSTVLQQLAKEIEASDAPDDKKKEWLTTIQDMLAHPFMQTILTLSGTALLQK